MSNHEHTNQGHVNQVQPTPDKSVPIVPAGYSDKSTNKPARLDDKTIIANSVFATPIVISRNGVDATMPVFVGSRKQWDGIPYIAFQAKADESKPIDEDIIFIASMKWLGRENVLNAINAFLRRFGQDAYKDNVANTGENAGNLNLSGLIKDWTEMAASGLKISELKELIDSEQKAYQEYVSTVVMIKLMDASTTSDEKEAIRKEVDAKVQAIANLRTQLENRSRKPSAEEQVDTVRPE